MVPVAPRSWLFLLSCLLVGSPVFAQDVILNEIMANPSGAEAYTEYVELFNRGGDPVDLSDWELSDGTGTDLLQPAPDSTNMVLPAGGYALILDSGYWSDGEGWYDDVIPPGTLLLTVPDAALGSGGLSNTTAETVTLIDRFGLVASQRTYVVPTENGVSEERIRVDGGEDDGNWAPSGPGGSPGSRNTVTPWPNDLAITLDSTRVAYQRQTDSFGLSWWFTVENRGSAPSEERSIEVRLAGPPFETDTLLARFDLIEMPPGSEFPAEWNESVDLPDGDYTTRLLLTPPDDDPASDTTATARLDLFTIPNPAEDWFAISEVMSAPGGELDVEWVELRVTRDEPFDPSGWGLRDASGTLGLIPDGVPKVQPDSLIVLASSDQIRLWPGVRDDQVILTDGWPSLNNDGDTLTLVTPTGSTYRTLPIPAAEPGTSLFYFLGRPYNTGWHSTAYEPFGTPGLPNWVVYPENDFSLDSASAWISWGESGEAELVHLSMVVTTEGWFYEEEIRYRGWAEKMIDGELVTIELPELSEYPAPPDSSFHWALSTRLQDFTVPGQWRLHAELLVEDADTSNNQISAVVGIPEDQNNADDPDDSAFSLNALTVSPNPFSPNGDGFEDETVFSFDYASDEIVVTVSFYDSQGRILGRPLHERRMPGLTDWHWDGRTGLSLPGALPLGLYVYHVEIRAADGSQSWEAKGALASAGNR